MSIDFKKTYFDLQKNLEFDEDIDKRSSPSEDNNEYLRRISNNKLILKENNLKINNLNIFNSHLLDKHRKSARINLKGDGDILDKNRAPGEKRLSFRMRRLNNKFPEEVSNVKSFRQVLDAFLSVKRRKNNIQIVVSFVSIFSLMFYILSTYFNKFFIYLDYFDYFICFVYFVDYMINICLAHYRLNHFLSYYSLLELYLIIPPLFSIINKNSDWVKMVSKIINISRVLRIIPFFKIFYTYKSNENDVKKQIWMIMITLMMMLIISSGVIQILELDEVEKRLSITYHEFQRDMLMMRRNFHHYIYFIVVTTSTVGYGDIVPYTIEGKIIVIGLVLFTLVLIPKQTNDLIQLMSAKSEYARKKYTASQDVVHVILTGEITLDSLKSFCKEFFHQDHGSQYRHVVIISNQHPSKEMEQFLNEKGNDANIFYLEGDPMNEKELLRADIGKARACILLNNKISHDSYSSDHQNLLLGLYIKKFVFNLNNENYQITGQEKKNEDQIYFNTNFRLCVQLIKPESKYHFYNSIQNIYCKKMQQDQLILIEEIKMNILAKSCLTPGILALLSNLLMSSSSLPHGTDSEWLKEYAEGRGHEIYRIPLGDNYRNYSFLEIVKDIYSRIHAITFALEIEIDRNTIIKLNPASNQTIGDIINNLTSNIYLVNKSTNSNPNIDSSSSSDERDEYLGRSNNFNNINDYSIHEKHDCSKIKFFIYLICSDKSVAEEVFSKNREERKNNNMRMSMGGIHINTSNLTISPYINELNRKRVKSNPLLQESDEDSTKSENEGEDFEISSDEYFLNNDGETDEDMKSELMQHTIKGSEEIVNHIIVCGVHPSLIHFVLPLRRKYLGKENIKYIVILAPHLPQKLYDSFGRFPKIIYIQGSPLLPENLFRANIKRADQAVILSMGKKNLKSSFDKSHLNEIFNTVDLEDDQMLDAETIFIYKAIKKANKDIQILTELIATNNVEYLLNKVYLNSVLTRKDFFPLYEFTPLFAAGEVFTPAIIDRITCQSFFSPHILIMLEQILNGGIREKNKKIKKLEEDIKIQNSYLWLIRVPTAMINETFEELFNHLIKSHKAVAIGLYRKNITDSSYYVYTNPKKSSLIRELDLAFVLGQYSDITDLLDDRRDEPEFLKKINKKKEKLGKFSSSSSSGNSKEELRRDITTTTDMNTKTGKNSLNNADNELNQYQFRRDEDLEDSVKTNSDENKIRLNEKKKSSSSKYQEIDNIKNKLDDINRKIGDLTISYNKIPEDIETFVNTEIDKELNFYVPSYNN